METEQLLQVEQASSSTLSVVDVHMQDNPSDDHTQPKPSDSQSQAKSSVAKPENTTQAEPCDRKTQAKPCGDKSDSNTAAIVSGEQEYETQFLGFAPKSFCDGLYNAVVDYSWEYFAASQEYMKSEFTDIIKKEELLRASEVFLSAVSKALDIAFDKFEYYILTNILCIPSDVLLPEDEVHRLYGDYTQQKRDRLDDELKTLKDRIKAAKHLNASLRQEFSAVDSVTKEYQRHLDLLRSMDKTVRESGVTEVRESLVFAVEKSNKILDILEQMKSSEAVAEPSISTEPHSGPSTSTEPQAGPSTSSEPKAELSSSSEPQPHGKRPLPDPEELLKLQKTIRLDTGDSEPTHNGATNLDTTVN